MWDLLIAQQSTQDPYAGPHLRISPWIDGTLEFRYVDTPNKSAQWRRVVAGDKAWAQLIKFFEQLHWRIEYRSESDGGKQDS